MKRSIALVLACTSQAVLAASFTVSADGQEVADQATGLVWRRCTEGMSWDGAACTGTAATFFTHENALARAREQAAATGKAWRLPNVKELSSITDRSRQDPAIDTTAFPGAQNFWFWSSSPYVGNVGEVWCVYFGYGYVGSYSRSSTFAVRLVRASQ